MNSRALITAAVVVPTVALGGVVMSFAMMVGSAAGGGAGAAAALLGAQAASAQCSTDTGPVVAIDPGAIKDGQLSAEQKENAATIVGQVKADVPAADQMRAATVALATAMQESTLKNIPFGDRDSLGLFQQRTGWGSTTDRLDAHKSAHMFLTGGQGRQPGLLDVSGWQAMSIAQAAQAVQRSAFPTAYAAWEAQATALAATLMGASGGPVGGSVPDPCGGGGVPGTTVPASAQVEAMLTQAKSLLGTPYVYGGTTYPPGVDCSGLLVYSYNKIGRPLRIRTSEQMWDSSTQLQAGTEQRGDLVFSEFVGGTAPGHVMIVWDPKAGTVIEAPHTGDVVKFLSYKSLSGIKFGRLKPSAWAAR